MSLESPKQDFSEGLVIIIRKESSGTEPKSRDKMRYKTQSPLFKKKNYKNISFPCQMA